MYAMLTSTLDGDVRVSLTLRPLYPTSGGKKLGVCYVGGVSPQSDLLIRQTKNHPPPPPPKRKLNCPALNCWPPRLPQNLPDIHPTAIAYNGPKGYLTTPPVKKAKFPIYFPTPGSDLVHLRVKKYGGGERNT